MSDCIHQRLVAGPLPPFGPSPVRWHCCDCGVEMVPADGVVPRARLEAEQKACLAAINDLRAMGLARDAAELRLARLGYRI